MTHRPELTDADLATLRGFLADKVTERDAPLNYTATRGLLFAVVTAPDLFQPSEVIPWIFAEDPDEEPKFEGENQLEQFIPAFISLWNDIAGGARTDEFSLEWLVGAEEVDDDLRHDWSFGFSRGSRLVGESWAEAVPGPDDDDSDQEVGEVHVENEGDSDPDTDIAIATTDEATSETTAPTTPQPDRPELDPGEAPSPNDENAPDGQPSEPSLHDIINYLRIDLLILGDPDMRMALFEGNEEESSVLASVEERFLDSAHELASWGKAFANAKANDFEDERVQHPTEPIRKEPEPGRNDPCPCGSGKKYKKCCLH